MEETLLLFLAGRGPNCTLSGLGSWDLSRANDGRLEVSGGLLVASLRGGVGRYKELSAPDIEVEVDAVFGSWAVGAGDGARLLSGSAAVSGSVKDGGVAAF